MYKDEAITITAITIIVSLLATTVNVVDAHVTASLLPLVGSLAALVYHSRRPLDL